MRILVAPNAFKETLSSIEVAEVLSEGIRTVFPDAEVELLPLADGGDGTLEVLTNIWNGRILWAKATDPLGRLREVPFGVDEAGARAVIEMARVSGLALLSEKERNPLRTSTFGLGQLIGKVVSSHVSHLFLGIGGSATNDGGVGMGEALGYRHLDRSNRPVPPDGGHLLEIDRIVPPVGKPARKEFQVSVFSDVDNPLFGPNGAANVFAPQKGATPDQVEILDRGLRHLSEIWKRDLGKEVSEVPGAGAAGGLGAGAMVYLDAELISGAEAFLELTNLRKRIEGCDWVITGEGRLDCTTLQGKLPGRVASMAQEFQVPCIGVCGSLDPQATQSLREHGFSQILEIAPGGVSLEERKRKAAQYAFETGKRIGEVLERGER